MNKITHYGVFLALLFSIAIEWNDIARVRTAAVFGLLAVLFYLLFMVFDTTDTHFPDREVDRKTRFLQRRRARRNAQTGLLLTLLFVIVWFPHSSALPILTALCLFLCLAATLASSYLTVHQERRKRKSTELRAR
ncbi:MAG: hypothetical protein GX751_05810 [Desulfuromonadaceae bacterium]|nr:hypothetical protein [Desulfuromonadaceae bacterium]